MSTDSKQQEMSLRELSLGEIEAVSGGETKTTSYRMPNTVGACVADTWGWAMLTVLSAFGLTK